MPGRPSSQNWVKPKIICHFLRNFDEFPNGFWFYSILAGWSTWQWVFLNFSQNFWSFDTPDTPGCASAVIWNHCLKQIWAIPPTVCGPHRRCAAAFFFKVLSRRQSLIWFWFCKQCGEKIFGGAFVELKMRTFRFFLYLSVEQ